MNRKELINFKLFSSQRYRSFPQPGIVFHVWPPLVEYILDSWHEKLQIVPESRLLHENNLFHVVDQVVELLGQLTKFDVTRGPIERRGMYHVVVLKLRTETRRLFVEMPCENVATIKIRSTKILAIFFALVNTGCSLHS